MIGFRSPKTRQTILQKWDLLIVSNNVCSIEGIQYALSDSPHFLILAVLADLQETLAMIAQVQPDFLVVDRPDRENFLYQIKTKYPQIALIAVGSDSFYADYCLNRAIPLKEQFEILVQKKLQSQLTFCIQGIPSYQKLVEKTYFSPKEREILAYLSYGCSYEEIGESLHLSSRTIQKHTDSLREKLNAKDKAHLICLAFRSGLVK
jgi:DNA-binding NarL/FixJ family response regulator